jgi:hypothetical protein
MPDSQQPHVQGNKPVSRYDRPGGMGRAYALNASAVTFWWMFFVSAGFTSPEILDAYYSIQAATLAKGCLAIDCGSGTSFYADATFFKGQYYFYWGLFPSAVYLLLRSAFGTLVAQYLLVAGFLLSLTYFYQRMIGQIVEAALDAAPRLSRYWRLSSLPLLWLFLLALPFPEVRHTQASYEPIWFFDRFSIYEQQILFGLSLAMPAIFAFITGLIKRRGDYLAVSTVLFSLAAWTRGTWFFPAVLSVPAAALFIRTFAARMHDDLRVRTSVLLLAASAALLGGLLTWNYVRFDSCFDFGTYARQHPVGESYLRVLSLSVSPETQFWNAVFNGVSYYGSPALLERLGLDKKVFAIREGMSPYFFSYNPHFLLVLVLLPLGLYRTAKSNRRLFIPMVVLAAVALYINFFIMAMGLVVLMRYFVEFYYLVILVLFAVLMVLIPFRIALVITVLAMALYLPDNFTQFLQKKPELRTLQNETEKNPDSLRTPSIIKHAVWPRGRIAADTSKVFTEYNLIGFHPTLQGDFLASDVAAAFVIPESSAPGKSGKGTLTAQGLQSLTRDGNVLVFLDDQPVGSIRVSCKQSIDAFIRTSMELRKDVPHKILIVFLPEGNIYLPPLPPPAPPLRLKSLVLSTQGS